MWESFYTPRLKATRAAYSKGCINNALAVQPSQAMQRLCRLPAGVPHISPFFAHWREQSHGINPASKTIFSCMSLNVHQWWFCWIICVDEWLHPLQLLFRDGHSMSAGYMCSEHYCGAAPQPRIVWLGNLGDGTEISGFFGTYEPLQASPGRKLEGKKKFLLPSFQIY